MTTLHAAPLQGHTDAAWRRLHSEIYGDGRGAAAVTYYTPFVRLEKNDPRRHDMRDFTSPLNEGVDLIPQIIFGTAEEFRRLVDSLVAVGAGRINLNCGCPFPLQTARGRGAASLALLPDIASVMAEYPSVDFSLKMRPGMTRPDEWRAVVDTINVMPLTAVTMHPRTAKQQYRGELHREEFAAFLSECRHPVIFNGDLLVPADIDAVTESYPGLAGIMAGRGLVGRPSLFAEYAGGGEWDRARRLDAMLRLHDRLYAHYCRTLCGDSQILSKIKPFWEYSEAEIGRKAWKALHKAMTPAKYRAALSMIG